MAIRWTNIVVAAFLSLPAGAQDDATARDPTASDGREEDADRNPEMAPPVLLQDSPAVFPAEALGSGIHGTVVLELTVSEAGEVTEAMVVRSVHLTLDAAALEAAQHLRFRPARVQGKPVPVRIQYRYVFSLTVQPDPVAVLKGVIRERGTRKPILSAVLLRAGTDEVIAEADDNGHFEVSLPLGRIAIDVKAPGYEPLTVVEELESSSLEVIYRLIPTGHPDPYVTIVRDERAREEHSRHSLYGRETREVPGTMGDPFRVVMVLPGVSAMNSGLSYPVVRGTQPASSAYFVDGVRVPNLYHLFIGHAVIHPDLVDRMDFYPGTPPARFGRVLGAVVDVRSRDIPADRIHGSASVDLVNIGGLVEGPLGPDTGFRASGRISATPFVLGLITTAQNRSTQLISDFVDYQGRLQHRIGGGIVRLSAMGAYDLIGNRGLESGEEQTIHQAFHRVDLKYERIASFVKASVAATLGYDSVGLFSGIPDEIVRGEFGASSLSLASRGSLEVHPTPTITVTSGGDVERRSGSSVNQLGSATGEGTVQLATSSSQTVFAAAWSQATWRPSERWTIRGGARLDSYYLTPNHHYVVVEPGLSVHFQPHPAVGLLVAGGWVHQPPTVLVPVPSLDVAGLRYGLQEAAQLSTRVDWTPAPGFDVTVEAYYTHLTRTHEFSLFDVLQQQLEAGTSIGQEQAGRGRAYGIELMLKHPLGDGWFGWLSYTLQRSERLTRVVDLERYRSERVVDVQDQMLPFAFDQTHNLNLALSYQLPHRITLGAVLHFNSGRPEAGQITSRTMRPGTDPDGVTRWYSVSLNRVDRLPPFFRLDLRASVLFTVEDVLLEAYLDVMNATVSWEVLGYQYISRVSDGSLEKRPVALPLVIPTLGLKGTF